MTREEIQNKLRQIIEPYVQDKNALDNLSGDTDMLRDLKVNSAHLVDIILDMEQEFDIEIDDETAETMVTVGQAVSTTEQLLKQQQ